MQFETIIVDIADGVAEVTLDRPDQHNTFTHQLHRELKEAFETLPRHGDVRAILLGAKGKTFSAGGDFDLILADREDDRQRRAMAAEGRALLMAVGDCPVPVVAALQGDAVGLGATLLLACDAVVASRNVQISDPHVVIGLVAGDGGCIVWPLNTSFMLAKRYLLTGDRVSAEDARSMGLFSDLVDERNEVAPAARALAGRLAALPPLAVQGTKRAMNQIFRQRMAALFDFGMAAEMETFKSDDLVEAISAFKERRPPKYTGS